MRQHAPLPRPGKFICIGLKLSRSRGRVGHGDPGDPDSVHEILQRRLRTRDPIILPSVSQQVDYEAEFAFVIGSRAKNVKAADWEDYVFGYTCVHDVSARDYQLATSQWTIGKTFDSFGPMGPELVSKDEIGDPNDLRIRFELNGRTLQDSSTINWSSDVPALLEYLSAVMTLEPGDIISTGTPPGVGMARKPPIYLKDGDVCTVEIEGIGTLTNPEPLRGGSVIADACRQADNRLLATGSTASIRHCERPRA